MKDPKDDQTIDAFAKKAMTPAERKQKQRAKERENGGKARLDCYIDSMHDGILDHLVFHTKKEKQKIVEMALFEYEKKLVERMGPEEANEYWNNWSIHKIMSSE